VIRFHLDFLSPYAYVAWNRVHPIAARHQRAVEAVPVLFAGLLAAHGTRGPADVPAKRAYVFKDAHRAAHAAGLRFGMPPTHPFNPLLALRMVGEVADPAKRKRLVDELFKAVWGKGGPGVTEPSVVAAIAERAGHDGSELVAAAGGETAKARLRATTEAAVADGVFGVPTMLVDGELFWGNDSLEHLDRFLSGEDPATRRRGP
jgi:2-hydroxychromene-2-carboxylate isomerase